MKCTGYWEECSCEDCKKVSYLYQMLEWLQTNERDALYIEEVISEIESMGYSI